MKRAATLLSQLSAQGKTLFTRSDARSATSLHPRHLDNLLLHLVKQKWLLRLAKGLYLIVPFEAGPNAEYTDWEKFTRYAERMPNRAIFKRAGYLAELLGLSLANLYSRWQAQLSQGYVRLDPVLPPGGRRRTRWRVQVNVPLEDLRDLQRHRSDRI